VRTGSTTVGWYELTRTHRPSRSTSACDAAHASRARRTRVTARSATAQLATSGWHESNPRPNLGLPTCYSVPRSGHSWADRPALDRESGRPSQSSFTPPSVLAGRRGRCASSDPRELDAASRVDRTHRHAWTGRIDARGLDASTHVDWTRHPRNQTYYRGSQCLSHHNG
jgi:hypothetical protein